VPRPPTDCRLIAELAEHRAEAIMGRIWPALAGAVLFLACQSASAQICRPVAERTGEVGFWIIASQPVGQLAKAETFWHLDVYATRAEAEAAKASGDVVVGSLGKTWLLTIVLSFRRTRRKSTFDAKWPYMS